MSLFCSILAQMWLLGEVLRLVCVSHEVLLVPNAPQKLSSLLSSHPVHFDHVLLPIAGLREVLLANTALKWLFPTVFPRVVLEVAGLRELLAAARRHTGVLHAQSLSLRVPAVADLYPLSRDIFETLFSRSLFF